MPEPLTATERAAIRQWIRQDPHWPEQHTMVLLDRFEATVQALEAERDDAVAECDTYQRRWQAEYLAATEARQRATRLAALAAAARAFIADSEAAGGPPPGTCNACYWTLRSAVAARSGD